MGLGGRTKLNFDPLDEMRRTAQSASGLDDVMTSPEKMIFSPFLWNYEREYLRNGDDVI